MRRCRDARGNERHQLYLFDLDEPPGSQVEGAGFSSAPSIEASARDGRWVGPAPDVSKVTNITQVCAMVTFVPDPITWMSTPEVASYLGVNTRTVYRLIDEGELPAHKIGRVIRLQEADVVDFVERTRIVPGTLEHLYPEPSRQEG